MTTVIQQVRLLISDPAQTDPTLQAFTDDDLQAFLDLNEQFPRLAAADALEQQAGKLLTVDSDQIKVDGSKQAATLMARAAVLRAQHYNIEGAAMVIVSGPVF